MDRFAHRSSHGIICARDELRSRLACPSELLSLCLLVRIVFPSGDAGTIKIAALHQDFAVCGPAHQTASRFATRDRRRKRIVRQEVEESVCAVAQATRQVNLMFNPQPELFSSTLELRPLKLEDLESLFLVASAPEVWKGHPARDRHQRAVFEPYAKFLLSSGTTLVVIDAQIHKIIGCSRYYVAPDQPESISIGFTFLHHSYWGGATNFELKRLMLNHAFQYFGEVWFHIAPSNLRSQKGTAKLGAEHVYDAVLDLSGGVTLWMCFRLTRGIWKQTCQNLSLGLGSKSG
jgi:N-acetyltransferase